MPTSAGALADQPLPEGVPDLLAPYLARQRWFAGPDDIGAADVQLERSALLFDTAAGRHRLWWAVVTHDGARYQLLVGERPGGEPAEFLNGHENAVVGASGDSYFYDGTLDPELAVPLLERISGGTQHADRVRPIGVEQSNTSLVYDDRIILKLFRRLLEGRNPDVEVTTALAAAGFEQVAPPLASWRDGDVDLAFAQEFLAGGSEGWALAITSLRDLYNAVSDDPAEAGGDFSSEAGRLGSMTARMHLALAESFGVDGDRLRSGAFGALIDDIERRLVALGPEVGKDLRVAAEPLLGRLRAVPEPGPAFRVHGDYHLGQVMRTDAGWYVLDFEGEPARSMEERSLPSSPLKDLTGMLRSFHYAARFALRARSDDELDGLEPAAQAWEEHNCAAFVDGYLGEKGIDALLPAEPWRAAVEMAYELDKALYELGYERSYRPDWVDIPLAAVERLIAGPSEG